MSETAVENTGIYTQTGRTIAIETVLGPDALLLIDVDGVEKLSSVFLYNAVFVTRLPASKIKTLLAEPVTVWLQNDNQLHRRPINGCIRRVTLLENRLRGFDAYRIEIVPRLWFLDCTADCRIFQNLSAPEIIQAVLREHDAVQFEFRLVKNDYPTLDYCVQYRESALAFVSRLMERFGIFYCHQHHSDRHVLVMLDSNRLAPFTEPRVLGLSLGAAPGDIESLLTDAVFRPGRWTMTDYDFEAPSKAMRKEVKTVLDVPRMDQHEIYDFPGGYTDQNQGEWLTHLRMEAEEALHLQITGKGRVATMDAGRRVQIVDDIDMTASGRRTYLLTELRHIARERSYFTAGTAEASHYENDFVAIPEQTPFRPQRVTPKPVIGGLQTATVISPTQGDPIFTDMYGRVKLHFHWDRRGDPNKDETSCWVRVSQAGAGSQWGGVSIPHAGQEVVVAFLEGDPDRPLVVGRVHNAEKMPPLALPSDKHKTMLRDHGNNKIMMNGKPGREHLTLVTPRSLNMIAMRNVARSLSAASSDMFGADQIDDWQDGGALNEVQRIYTALTVSQTPGSLGADDGNPTGTILSPQTGRADTGTLGVDINTFTDGKTNVVSLGNNNAWCYGDYNTWVNGVSQSKYNGGNYQEIFKTNVQIVFGDNLQQTLGASQQFTEGASSSIVVGGGSQMIFGGSLVMTMPWAAIINAGPQYTLSAADEKNVSLSSDTECAEWSVKTGAASMTAVSIQATAPTVMIQTMLSFHVESTPASVIEVLPEAINLQSPMIMFKGALIKVG